MKAIGLMARLPPDVKAWLADEAKTNGRSMNGMLVSILKEKKGAQAAQNEKTPIDAGKQ